MIYNADIEIKLTPEHIAEEFCNMSEKQQVIFFNEIGRIVREEWDNPFEFQMQAIVDDDKLNEDGHTILNIIRDYMG